MLNYFKSRHFGGFFDLLCLCVQMDPRVSCLEFGRRCHRHKIDYFDKFEMVK